MRRCSLQRLSPLRSDRLCSSPALGFGTSDQTVAATRVFRKSLGSEGEGAEPRLRLTPGKRQTAPNLSSLTGKRGRPWTSEAHKCGARLGLGPPWDSCSLLPICLLLVIYFKDPEGGSTLRTSLVPLRLRLPGRSVREPLTRVRRREGEPCHGSLEQRVRLQRGPGSLWNYRP